MNVPYENLDLIPLLLTKIEKIEEKIQELNNKEKEIDLSKPTNVAKYLKISNKTLYNMIEEGRFKKDIHYKRVLNKNSTRIVFIESAIRDKGKHDFL
ncbi:helix-turn-helix transcriptional regulator [Arcobacter sp. YIC-464]|uniref:helix-turn-helix transcriptional regulator n=1 Tax=Arcobacter sp. YIC-464 TaxID=3376631 RepID=UPI003C16A99E